MTLHEERQQAVVAILTQLQLPVATTIRAWIEDDFSAIQELSTTQGWPSPQSRPEESLAAWKNSWPTLVAVEAERVVGFVRAFTDGNITTYVPELLVAMDMQRRGIGRALLDACHLLYPRTRIELLSTETSQSFYTAHGFRIIGPGLRKSYVYYV